MLSFTLTIILLLGGMRWDESINLLFWLESTWLFCKEIWVVSEEVTGICSLVIIESELETISTKTINEIYALTMIAVARGTTV